METTHQPLADVLRPKTLDDVIGQEHLVGPNGIIRKLLASEFLPSMVLWGPPGCGKTTLANLLATLTKSHFEAHSAVTSALADIRRVVKEANERLQTGGGKTILFIDEIHRFNKAQQDALLPHVERGTVIFIGATTENPSFEVIAPLLSRCRVLVLKPLGEKELGEVLARGASHLGITLDDEAKAFLMEIANGDARALLTILDVASHIKAGIPGQARNDITVVDIEEAAQKKMLQYDKGGEEHYNTISAYIKSMRASDVDAALYYLARMVAAGEDPLFIARRMVVFASEDIGVAQPTALVVANAVFDACNKVGYPEAQLNLAHGTVYLALAKKDRSANDGFFAAMSDVQKLGNLPVPLKIRNAPTKLMKDLGYHKGYEKYPSTRFASSGQATTESLLPDKIKGKKYYKSSKS